MTMTNKSIHYNYYPMFYLFSLLNINKMFDGKFIATLISLVVAVIAICNFNTKNSIKEGYGMLPSKTTKFDRVVAADKQAAAKGQFYSVPGTYQAILNPRFSSVDYGSNIRYKMPSIEHTAVPTNPLTYGQMAMENYKHPSNTVENYSSDSCPQTDTSFYGGAPIMNSDFTDGNYKSEVDKAQSNDYPTITDMISGEDMTTVNSLGEPVQTIVYDRIMYVNRNKRTRGLGDPIRGDLAIVPCSAEWFRPSATPSVDLQQGAMNVLAGDNESTNALNELIMATSGVKTVAGVDLSSSKVASTTNGLADYTVTAYP